MVTAPIACSENYLKMWYCWSRCISNGYRYWGGNGNSSDFKLMHFNLADFLAFLDAQCFSQLLGFVAVFEFHCDNRESVLNSVSCSVPSMNWSKPQQIARITMDIAERSMKLDWKPLRVNVPKTYALSVDLFGNIYFQTLHKPKYGKCNYFHSTKFQDREAELIKDSTIKSL